jgi:hypothetical protein
VPKPRQGLFYLSVFHFWEKTFLFKIAMHGVSLWHFCIYLYYIPNWFISSIFLLSTLVPFLGRFQHSFLYREHIKQYSWGWDPAKDGSKPLFSKNCERWATPPLPVHLLGPSCSTLSICPVLLKLLLLSEASPGPFCLQTSLSVSTCCSTGRN